MVVITDINININLRQGRQLTAESPKLVVTIGNP
jgi:hypothetical protein